MPEIKPFRAVFYNRSSVQDLSRVVCPPYDVISPAQQDAYYDLSEHNFIRILLGKDAPNDDQHHNKYTRAKSIYQDWLKAGILRQDTEPCLYYYQQEFKVAGEKQSRIGFIALMKIEDETQAHIFPHENTHSRAKEDRYRLWSTLEANLSPIFVCYSDQGRKMEKIFHSHVENQESFIDVQDEEVRHHLWRLEDPQIIEGIREFFLERHLFIADGHHRYEVAKQIRQHYISKGHKAGEDAPFQYVMTYFTNMDSKDLRILPIHRIVKSLPKNLDFIEEYFRIDRVKSIEDLQIFLAKAGRNEHAFGLYTRDSLRLLRLKNKFIIDEKIAEGSSDFRQLDATILKYFVFDVLGVRSEDIIYSKDLLEVKRTVDEGQAEAGFFLNPVRMPHLKNIALNRERMPPKTTYFYPKVLSGLTVYPLT